MAEVPVVQIGRRNRSIDSYENRHLQITMCVCVVEWLVSHGLLDVTSKPSIYSRTNQGSHLSMGLPPITPFLYELLYGSRGAKEVRRCKVSF